MSVFIHNNCFANVQHPLKLKNGFNFSQHCFRNLLFYYLGLNQIQITTFLTPYLICLHRVNSQYIFIEWVSTAVIEFKFIFTGDVFFPSLFSSSNALVPGFTFIYLVWAEFYVQKGHAKILFSLMKVHNLFWYIKSSIRNGLSLLHI